MTPLAARLYRSTDNAELRQHLADAQFFECSSLFELANEMVVADLAAGCLEYSTFAQLPAPATVIEFRFGQDRALLLAGQEGNHLKYMMFQQWNDGIAGSLNCGFKLGSGHNDVAEWDEDVLKFWSEQSGIPQRQFASQQATGISGLLEKMLCMINQPGLVDRHARRTDKRVLREAARDPKANQPTDRWFECRIRPGHHGEAVAGGEATPRALHYVRKHFKPSVDKWIEGYWRGDIAYGLHRKFYNVSPPERKAT